MTSDALKTSFTPPPHVKAMRVPEPVIRATRLRREGRLHDAVAVMEAALAAARATQFDMAYRDRVLIGTTLADLYTMSDQHDRARHLLRDEIAFAEQIVGLVGSGPPEQVQAARQGLSQLTDRATQLAVLHRQAPPLDVAEWIQGAPTTLADLHGRVVLLEFWARSCPPCVASFPVLAELHETYCERGLTVLALTRYDPERGGRTDEEERERALIADFVGDHLCADIAVGVAPDGRLQQRYGADRMPSVAVIDRFGNVQFASSFIDKTKLRDVIAKLIEAR